MAEDDFTTDNLIVHATERWNVGHPVNLVSDPSRCGVSGAQLGRAALEADNAALTGALEIQARVMGDLMRENAALRARLTTFGDLTKPDLPEPPRRPDGTLAPQPKPLPVLKTATPSRRIGGE